MSAPWLRPHGTGGREGGQSTDGDPLPTFSLEGELHDESMLPHPYASAEIERMFPQIQAAPVQPNAEDWITSADRGQVEREHGGAQAGRDLGVRGHGGAAATTDRRKVVRRNIGIGGERARKVNWSNVQDEEERSSLISSTGAAS